MTKVLNDLVSCDLQLFFKIQEIFLRNGRHSAPPQKQATPIPAPRKSLASTSTGRARKKEKSESRRRSR